MMIKLTIELLPAGGGPSKVLGIALIINDGTGDQNRGSYVVRLYKWGKGRRIWKEGRLVGFPRKRQGPWDLLLRALQETVGDRQ